MKIGDVVAVAAWGRTAPALVLRVQQPSGSVLPLLDIVCVALVTAGITTLDLHMGEPARLHLVPHVKDQPGADFTWDYADTDVIAVPNALEALEMAKLEFSNPVLVNPANPDHGGTTTPDTSQGDLGPTGVWPESHFAPSRVLRVVE